MSSKPISFIIDTTLNNTVTINKLIKRGDTLDLEIKVFENGVLKDLEGESISLILEKSDKTNIEKSIVDIGNPLKIKLDIQATNSIGFTNGEVFITDVDGNISSNTFVYEVVNDLSSRILESSKDDCETLDQLKKIVNQNTEVIENYKGAIQDVAGTTESAAALSELKKYIGPNLENLTLQNNKAATNKNNLDVANEQAVKNYDALNQLGDATNLAKKVEANTTQLSDKAKQTDLNATNKNVSANTTNLANHKAETIAYKTFATRDAQITGTQTIILPFTPKYVQIKANIDTTNYMSIGDTDGINHSCLFTFNSVNKFSASNSSDIVMHTGGADIVWGTVTFGDNSINITFSKSGTTVTGTIYMSILAMTH